MKERVFELSLLIIGIIIIRNLVWQVVYVTLILIYWLFKYKKNLLLVFVIFSYFLFRTNIIQSRPRIYHGKISEIRDKYCVVMMGLQKVIAYGIDDPQFDSVISFSGEYQKIHSVPGFFSFQFSEWLRYQGIEYQIYIKEYQEIKNGSSFRNQLYLQINQIHSTEVRAFLLKTIFSINNSTDQLNEIILGSGMHIIVAANFLQSVLSLFMFSKAAKRSSYLFITITSLMFHYYFLLFRFYTRIITKKAKVDQKNQLGLFIIIVLSINPYYLFQLRFLVPLLFQFISLFQKKTSYLTSFFVMIPIQLGFFYQCNLFSIILFPVVKIISFISYWCSIIALICHNYKIIIMFQQLTQALSLPKFIITGKPNAILLLFWFLISSNYLISRKKKLLLIFVLLLLFNQFQTLFYFWGEVTQVYVGQGDCSLIRKPFSNKVILIDSGPITGFPYIQQYLDGLGIKEIEAIFISHDDLDHSGSLETIQENYQVNQIVTNKEEKLELEDIEFYFLLNETRYEAKNDNSLIIYFSLNQLSYLYLGDISREVEIELVNSYPKLKVDILKLAHHGSKTSTSYALLDSVMPKLAIISSGYQNRYQHPSEIVIRRLVKTAVPYLNTAEVGDIQILFFSFSNLLLTRGRQFVIME